MLAVAVLSGVASFGQDCEKSKNFNEGAVLPAELPIKLFTRKDNADTMTWTFLNNASITLTKVPTASATCTSGNVSAKIETFQAAIPPNPQNKPDQPLASGASTGKVTAKIPTMRGNIPGVIAGCDHFIGLANFVLVCCERGGSPKFTRILIDETITVKREGDTDTYKPIQLPLLDSPLEFSGNVVLDENEAASSDSPGFCDKAKGVPIFTDHPFGEPFKLNTNDEITLEAEFQEFISRDKTFLAVVTWKVKIEMKVGETVGATTGRVTVVGNPTVECPVPDVKKKNLDAAIKNAKEGFTTKNKFKFKKK